MEQLRHEQALISKKSESNLYSVKKEIVNSQMYHKKFMKLSVRRSVQEELYKQAGRLLEFVDGQAEERLIAVNARTGKLIVDNLQREGSIAGTGFTNEEYKKNRKLQRPCNYDAQSLIEWSTIGKGYINIFRGCKHSFIIDLVS